ncbi:RCC1-like G exchanging factor-like protein [Periplaneta americana]|uniref:RCC1-like G exchanging factor-like protein n=1 Tax=Periplaneta americana TaxID=6978 RepID=UPI0037E82DB5
MAAIKKLNLSWCQSRRLLKIDIFNSSADKKWTNLQMFVRHYVKRKYPINPEEAEKLPVFQYASTSEPKWRVYVWGVAEHGALGVNLQLKKSRKPISYLQKPVRTHFAEQHKIVDVASGYGFTALAVHTKDKYKVFGCGINTDSQIGYHAPRRDHPLQLILSPAPIELPLRNTADTRVKHVAAGRAHLLVLTDKEGAFSLGSNVYGQCGRPIVEEEKYSGSQIIHNIPDMNGVNIRSIECGQDHSLFVTENGEVYACGWGADGQTGLGHFKTEWQPTRVTGDVVGENIVKVSCTADCVLALNDKGEVFGWGNSEYSQLLHEESQQINVARQLKKCRSLGKIVDVAAGGSFCIICNEDGDVFVWGYGILGKGPVVDHSKEPTQIPATLFGRNEFQPESRVTAVSAGISHLGAISNYGDLYMWGHNKGGCLGIGHVNDQYFPLKVAVGARVKKVSCGVDHTVALCLPFV